MPEPMCSTTLLPTDSAYPASRRARMVLASDQTAPSVERCGASRPRRATAATRRSAARSYRCLGNRGSARVLTMAEARRERWQSRESRS